MIPYLKSWFAPLVMFIGFWIILQSVGGKFLRDPGKFWHTRTGEKILEEGFLRTDPYTFTFQGTWWVPYQWLGEVAMAKIHAIAGLDSLLAVSTAIVATLFTWFALKVHRLGLHPIFTGAVILLTFAAMASHFHVRPHLVTFMGMVILTQTLLRFESGRISPSQLAWILPLTILWANTHGGVLGGVATVILAILGWGAFAALGLRSPVRSFRHFFHLCGLPIGMIAALFCSPYGADLPKTWFLITGMPKLPMLIQEHSRFDIANPQGWPVLGMFALYLFLLSGIKISQLRVTWLLPLCWFAQAMLRVRHGSIFAAVSLVVMIDLFRHTCWAMRLSRFRADIFSSPGQDRSTCLPLLVISTCLLSCVLTIQYMALPIPLFAPGSAKLDPQRWPTEILGSLKVFEPHSPEVPRRIFNDYIDGGFIIYYAPNYQVFVDDRCEVFGDDWLENLVRASVQDTDHWMKIWQEQYGPFYYALTRTDSAFDQYFLNRPEEWRAIQRGQHAAFYVRATISGKIP